MKDTSKRKKIMTKTATKGDDGDDSDDDNNRTCQCVKDHPH